MKVQSQSLVVSCFVAVVSYGRPRFEGLNNDASLGEDFEVLAGGRVKLSNLNWLRFVVAAKRDTSYDCDCTY